MVATERLVAAVALITLFAMANVQPLFAQGRISAITNKADAQKYINELLSFQEGADKLNLAEDGLRDSVTNQYEAVLRSVNDSDTMNEVYDKLNRLDFSRMDDATFDAKQAAEFVGHFARNSQFAELQDLAAQIETTLITQINMMERFKQSFRNGDADAIVRDWNYLNSIRDSSSDYWNQFLDILNGQADKIAEIYGVTEQTEVIGCPYAPNSRQYFMHCIGEDELSRSPN
ncbi:hypothetical protein [Labrenzia sp. VG12]|uniref:hypothetical protein n=1 Tax=Labrenzia sp. VG12 TaxID=2021862 RepID=UPI000B8BCD8A|nr:hypothetical protein [Labrenzia sp. VG12]ASP34101.1 hypothetical protein CHH27_13305 [Labrenzia sp. VG12]